MKFHTDQVSTEGGAGSPIVYVDGRIWPILDTSLLAHLPRRACINAEHGLWELFPTTAAEWLRDIWLSHPHHLARRCADRASMQAFSTTLL